MYVEDFGCVLTPFRAEWSEGLIEPIPGFEDSKRWVEEHSHPDGYVYPPQIHTVTEARDGTTTPVPNTTRPALLWSPPATHSLTLKHETPGDLTRKGVAGFVIHFAGFLCGYRSQFSDWWTDGRIPAKCQADLGGIGRREASQCLDKASATWSSWGHESRQVMINALYFHNRLSLYEWDWERFQAEYQVMDALYAVARRELGTPRVKHHERLEALCNQFGVPIDVPAFQDIAKYRNALVHEVLWGTGMPGEGFVEGHRKGMLLGHINRRLGLAVLGISAAYVRSPWASLVTRRLDLDP